MFVKRTESPSKARMVFRVVATGTVTLIVIAGAFSAYAMAFQHRIYPGVSIGSIPVGGLTEQEAFVQVSSVVEELTTNTIDVEVHGERQTLSLDTVSLDDPDLSRPVIDTDVAAAVSEAWSYGRSESVFLNLVAPILVVIEQPIATIPTEIEEEEMRARLHRLFPDFADEPKDTHFVAEKSGENWVFTAVEGDMKDALDVPRAVMALEDAVSHVDPVLTSHVWTIPVVLAQPAMGIEEAARLAPAASALLERTPLELIMLVDDGQHARIDYMEADDLAPMIQPSPDGIVIDREALEPFVIELAENVDRPAQDARLILREGDNSRVESFTPSHNGRVLRVEPSMDRIIEALSPESEAIESINLVVEETFPSVPVADTNDLGIREILGVGTSDFSGSPTNRVKNIQNGAAILNGRLIAPGETFSLVQSLKPFTFDNGYLPELVIKGDRIEPEIGGGLCQIGTTTFRATMNAGLEVTERRNHSLVVNYYNDPSNGNPGTDATLYDSSPDYKFTNDTEHYILLQTEVDLSTYELRFTFWGTPDGRRGSYTAPVVQQWFPAGSTQYIKTTDLPPGVEQCQGAHPGAVTSFTYQVERPDGTIDETEYTSRYRSLPRICLIGVTKEELNAPEKSEGSEEDTLPEEGVSLSETTESSDS